MRKLPYTSDDEIALLAEVHRREAEHIAYAMIERGDAKT